MVRRARVARLAHVATLARVATLTSVTTTGLSLGIVLWNQQATWDEFERAAVKAEALGYDHIWTWDHLYGIVGDPYQPTWEGYSALAALAKVTSRAKLGLFVGAIPFRNPMLVAKALTTLDHISDGRAIAGLGAAWFELEHQAAGIDFGRSVGERLDWLDEATGGLRRLFDGERVTSAPGGHYRLADLVLLPRPVQRHLPIMIGGGGLRKTLRIVAEHADMWNTGGDVARLTEGRDTLYRHCEAVGRDPAAIELTYGFQPVLRATEAEALAAWRDLAARNRMPIGDDTGDMWATTPEVLAERMRARAALGFRTAMAELPAPYDDETMERLISEVAPAVGA
jgi:alkanesulfonate monooxygenase SsuD/methylene tetrahydromethanopterin reductase-like flavin-dependent oxidoreductase (luciferase family)